jgi:hypothetical protein
VRRKSASITVEKWWLAWQKEHVNPRCLLILSYLCLVGMLSACRTAPKPVEPVVEATGKKPPGFLPARMSPPPKSVVPVQQPSPSAATPKKSQTPTAPKAPREPTEPREPPSAPTPKENSVSIPAKKTLDSYVTRGRLEGGATPLAFVPKEVQQADSPGLFEDAIILSRLRAALKASGAPALATESVRVQAGDIYLNFLPEDNVRASAGYVDAALAIPGVRRVIVGQP